MKKLFLFIGALSLVACSESENNDVQTESPDAVVNFYFGDATPEFKNVYFNSDNSINYFEYSNKRKEKFFYENQKVIKIETFDSNNELIKRVDFIYENNILVSAKKDFIRMPIYSLENYIYGNDGEIDINVQSIRKTDNFITGVNFLNVKIQDNNLTYLNQIIGFNLPNIEKYLSYDDKFNLFSEQLSLHSLVLVLREEFSNNNLISITGTENFTFINEYVENNFLISSKKIDSNNQIFYTEEVVIN